MIGNPDHNDRKFDPEIYEEFYSDHHFEPIPESYCLEVNEVIPRFGWAFDQVEKLKPKTLLDLGCLDGSFALTVAKQLGVRCDGVDLTKDGIKLAIQRSGKYRLPAYFNQGTVEHYLEYYAIQGTKFDVVTAFEILEHVKDVPLLLSLIDKVLAPGGSVLISTPSYESPIYGANDEDNKCHIRLYTTKDEDYEQPNKFGNVRKATSITKEIGKQRIKDMVVHNELINLRYE